MDREELIKLINACMDFHNKIIDTRDSVKSSFDMICKMVDENADVLHEYELRYGVTFAFAEDGRVIEFVIDDDLPVVECDDDGYIDISKF